MVSNHKEIMQEFVSFVYGKSFHESGFPSNLNSLQTFRYIEDFVKTKNLILLPGSGGPYLKEIE